MLYINMSLYIIICYAMLVLWLSIEDNNFLTRTASLRILSEHKGQKFYVVLHAEQGIFFGYIFLPIFKEVRENTKFCSIFAVPRKIQLRGGLGCPSPCPLFDILASLNDKTAKIGLMFCLIYDALMII